MSAVKKVREEAAPSDPRRVWRYCRDVIPEILERSDEEWPTLSLGGVEIAMVRPGGIVELIGGTGRGKTSLAACMLVEHARSGGIAIPMSLELPGDEWVARAIGTSVDASWPDVLRGKVARQHMLDALPETLAIVDRQSASPEALAAAIVDLRARHGNAPILVGIDYVQLMKSGASEIRTRVIDVMSQIDSIARTHRVVVIALSQGSRASSRGLSSGERVGADTTDAGAESAALEQWSTATIAIGAWGATAEDGSVPVELSLGKGRMTGGDRVFPARYCGRSGLWRITGEARTGTEVRESRKSEKASKRTETATLAIEQLLSRAAAPMYVTDIVAQLGGERQIVYTAVRELRESGIAVRVRGKKRGGAWPVWTAERAAEAGIDTVPEGVEG